MPFAISNHMDLYLIALILVPHEYEIPMLILIFIFLSDLKALKTDSLRCVAFKKYLIMSKFSAAVASYEL